VIEQTSAETEVTWLRFAVLDTGIGISAAQKANLFQPFSQGDATVARRFGGTGLGLAICRNLVELMGGRIGVDSTPGQGSIFWFEIPLQIAGPEHVVAEHPGSGATTSRNIEGGPSQAESNGKRHILVVEDVITNQLIVKDYLQRRGYLVSTAENGRAALSQVKHEPPDLILMDCQMPEMDGFEATRQLRVMETETGAPRRPIIALTADVLAESRDQCLAAGMDDFLSKPINFKSLDSTLARWLGTPVLPASETAAAESTPPDEVAPVEKLDAASIPELDTLDELLGKQMMNARRVAQRIATNLPGSAGRAFGSVSAAIARMNFQEARAKLAEFRSTYCPDAPPDAASTAPAVIAEAVFDMASALENLNGEVRLLKMAAATLPNQIVIDRKAIDAAVAAGDHEALRKSAHRLKGALASIGAREAASASFALENAGRHGKEDDYPVLFRALDDALARLEPVLNNFIDSPGATAPPTQPPLDHVS
jgi:CheY-like chemotaxis protein